MAIRWGIVSAGKICHDFVTALGTLPEEEHKVIAVAARDSKRAHEFAKLHNIPVVYDSYEKIVHSFNIDVIYIGSVNNQHYPLCKLALEAGKHVLCEKPLTVNFKQTKELIELAAKKKLFFMEAVWSRCFPVYDILRKELESGAIGDIKQVIATLGQAQLDSDENPMRRDLGRGSILDLGVYPLQLVELVYGPVLPKQIKSVGSLNSEGVDMNFAAALEYANGEVGVISCHTRVKLPNEAFIIGTKGTIKISDPFWCPTNIISPTKSSEIVLPPVAHPLFFQNSAGLRYEAMEVRRCLQLGLLESPKMTHADSLVIAQIQDKLRSIIGVHFDEDNSS